MHDMRYVCVSCECMVCASNDADTVCSFLFSEAEQKKNATAISSRRPGYNPLLRKYEVEMPENVARYAIRVDVCTVVERQAGGEVIAQECTAYDLLLRKHEVDLLENVAKNAKEFSGVL